MTNPAEYLLNFFDLQTRKQHGWPLRPLLAACNAVDDELKTRNDLGIRTPHFDNITSYIRIALHKKSSDDLSKIATNATGGKCEIEGPLRDLLQALSGSLQAKLALDPPTTKDIRSLIQAVREAVRADDSLPAALKMYLLKATGCLEVEVDQAEIFGEFSIEDALARLFGLIHSATDSSETPEAWRLIWEKWGIPITQAVIASTPQIAIGAASLLAVTN